MVVNIFLINLQSFILKKALKKSIHKSIFHKKMVYLKIKIMGVVLALLIYA